MENEFSVDVHRIDGTDIIFVKISGEIKDDESKILYKKTEQVVLTLNNPDNVKLLIDASDAGKAFSKARKQFVSVLKKDDVKKVAILGGKPFMRAMLAFYRILSGVDKIRGFSLKENAIAWLSD